LDNNIFSLFSLETILTVCRKKVSRRKLAKLLHFLDRLNIIIKTLWTSETIDAWNLCESKRMSCKSILRHINIKKCTVISI
jgi:hypothetical protein